MIKKLKLGSLYMGDEPTSGKTRRYDCKGCPPISIRDTVPGQELRWVRVGSMLIADRSLLTSISWDDLNRNGLVLGRTVTIDGQLMRCRLIRGSEWDFALGAIGEDPQIWNMAGEQGFWLQDKSAKEGLVMAQRGFPLDSNVKVCGDHFPNLRARNMGYRPVLEFAVDPASVDGSIAGQRAAVSEWPDSPEWIEGEVVEVTAYDLVLTKALFRRQRSSVGEQSFAKFDVANQSMVVERDKIGCIILKGE